MSRTDAYIPGYAASLQSYYDAHGRHLAELRGYRCVCSGDEPFGDYQVNSVAILRPYASKRPTPFTRDGQPVWVVNVDRCMVREVTDLWRAGIRTVESCCGHRQARGYVAVDAADEEQMESLGYVRDPSHPHVFFARTRP